MINSEHDVADMLNRGCDCAVTDLTKLRARIESALESEQSIAESHPHLFSEMPVFLDPDHVSQMRRVIGAIEATTRLSTYRDAVLGHAPDLARIDPRTCGVFTSLDFHITPEGPKLIEVNTNAGGAFLNVAAHDAQRACCPAADEYIAAQPSAAHLEAEIVTMFQREWLLARGAAPLRTIAIVDVEPRGQFLYPEFQLAKQLLECHGVRTYIADPSELELSEDCIQLRGERIDLVYNRLTDFYFDAPSSHVLRLAYQRDLAVITPHPRAHALYANKRNLALAERRGRSRRARRAPRSRSRSWLDRIPSTREAAGCAETWWRDRKDWFFKPRSGYGSRGTYRGDKLTRRVFAEVVSGEYIAQELTPPSERWRSTARRQGSLQSGCALLRLRRKDSAHGGETLPGPDDELPNGGRRICAGLRRRP